MPRTKKRLIYTEPELDALIVQRAADMGISVNEWYHRVSEHYLAVKGQAITYTETKKVTL